MADVRYSEKVTVYMSSADRLSERQGLLISRCPIGAGAS